MYELGGRPVANATSIVAGRVLKNTGGPFWRPVFVLFSYEINGRPVAKIEYYEQTKLNPSIQTHETK